MATLFIKHFCYLLVLKFESQSLDMSVMLLRENGVEGFIYSLFTEWLNHDSIKQADRVRREEDSLFCISS